MHSMHLTPDEVRRVSAWMRWAMSLFAVLGAACSDAVAPSGNSAAAALAVGQGHLCQIASGGTTCWGAGQYGQLGDGLASANTIKVEVAVAQRFVSITAGPAHTCALDADGVAWCWGNNGEAELGIGTTPDDDCNGFPCQARPAKVATTEHFASLTAGDFFTCGLSRSGKVYCWGLNEADQLGTDAAGDDCGLPCSRTPIVAAGGKQFAAVSAFKNGACAIDVAGVAWCWGIDVITHQHSSTPIRMGIGEGFTQIAAGGLHACALTRLGAAWCWGIDALGAGAGTLESDHPVAVSGHHAFSSLASARYTSCGIDADSKAWCWGANTDGALGLDPAGSATRSDEPTPVSGDLRFSTLTGGFTNYCGSTASGTVACWGRGNEGQLLNGGQSSTTPVVLE